MTIMLGPLLHSHFLLLLLLCCLTSSSGLFLFKSPVVDLVACRPHQIKAFTQFKNEFDTRGCNHSDSSNRVWCDNSTGAVSLLRLKACLEGTLKPNSSLFGFHQLRYLDLRENNFISSSLPSEFGNLNRLEVLLLSSSGFTGQIPFSFNNLSLLSLLSLSHNKLTGSFPLVGNLTNLSVLDLSYNHFFGTLKPSSSLFELHQLRYLDIGYNNFSSQIPSEFGKLNKLEAFSLPSSGFFGPVPITFSNLTLITHLYLDQNKLTGNFPLVQNLTKLFFLEIYDNHFSGTIPSYLLTMPFLSYLDLRGNNLNGSIEVPTSSSIQTLYLGRNHFDAQILEPISKLLNLTQLDLSFLNTSYPIDLDLFSSLKSLLYLDLSGNSISRASLSSYSHIPLNLDSFCLSKCGIREFPNILKTLKKLAYIDLSNNRIKGKVPEWLWNLPRLSSVSISNNLFNGFEGSAEVLLNSSVKYVDLQQNSFEGEIPSLPLSINLWDARDNRVTGSIPLSVCNCKSLMHLSLSDNNLTGSIPQCLSNLAVLNLRKNNLEGTLPDMFYAGALLRTLDVGHNRLTGKLPRSLLNCSSLEFLNVEHNNFEDKFPLWLKTLPRLQILTLRSNNFFGPISSSDQGPLGFPQLRILELADNNFTGILPPSYFVNWKASSITLYEDGGLYMEYSKTVYGELYYISPNYLDLQYKGISMEQEQILISYSAIDFSGNKFEGQIPESIGLLKALIALNLSNNAFTGHIPSSLAKATALESLDLSSNQLSGTIPNGLGTLSFLAYMNVSHNNLKGEIPQGTQITGQPKSSFEGNAGLCGLPLDESCFGGHSPPTQQPQEEANEEEEEEEVLNWKAVAIGYGLGFLFGLAIAQLIVSYKHEWLAKLIGPNTRRTR